MGLEGDSEDEGPPLPSPPLGEVETRVLLAELIKRGYQSNRPLWYLSDAELHPSRGTYKELAAAHCTTTDRIFKECARRGMKRKPGPRKSSLIQVAEQEAKKAKREAKKAARDKRKAKKNMLLKRLAALAGTQSDAKVANKIGCNTSRVRQYRLAYEIAPGGRSRWDRDSILTPEAVIAAVAEGLSDREIGKRLNYSPAYISVFRHKHRIMRRKPR